MSDVGNEVLVGGYSVDKGTLLVAGVTGGVLFIVGLVMLAYCFRRWCRKGARKNGDYDGVNMMEHTTRKELAIDIDNPEAQEVDDDDLSAYFSDDGPQLTQTGTFNTRQLDLSKFVDVNYPEEDTASSQDGDHVFAFDKCMAYVTKYLFAWKKENPPGADMPELDAGEYIAELEARWRLIDEKLCGVVSVDELRAAVWNNDADYEGLPMAEGPLPPSLQSIVDDILDGVGLLNAKGDETFTFWDFVNYLLRDADGIDYGIVVPPAPASWGYVGHR